MVGKNFHPAHDFATQHQGSETLAINNTYLHRTLALLALSTTAKLFVHDGPCIPITRRKILKKGFSVHLTEAATMRYIAQHTSIPVPKVHCSFVHRSKACIIMQRIQGDNLAAAWPKLSQESLSKIYGQLKEIIQQLRALKPTADTGVQSCVGGSLFDSRLPHGTPRFGPFDTIHEFHRWLRNNIEAGQPLGAHLSAVEVDAIQAMIAGQDGPCSPPVFTHGDLNPTNIMVRGDQIVGILDWEFAGWYPDYWEYTSAWFGNRTRGEWQTILHTLLDPYPEDLLMETTRNKWWGEW